MAWSVYTKFESLTVANVQQYVRERHQHLQLTFTDFEEFLKDATPAIRVSWHETGAAEYVGEFWLETREDGSKFLYGEW